MGRRGREVAAVAAALLLAIWAWRVWWPNDERQIKRELQEFVSEFNRGGSDGLGTVVHAAKLGAHFTDDVVVDLGPGTAPIRGRETLVAMAARLQPRTAAFALEFADVSVALGSNATADVSLTAVIRRRSAATGEESLDAREFTAGLVKQDGRWRVNRVTAVDTLR
jgi:hypothetical protein